MKTLTKTLIALLLPAVASAAALTGDLPLGPGLAGPAFEVLPSTRRVTGIHSLGPRVLVGTTGGLVEWVPSDGTRKVLLPGVPIRDLAPVPAFPGRLMVASDAGAYIYQAGACVPLVEEPTQALLVENQAAHLKETGSSISWMSSWLWRVATT